MTSSPTRMACVLSVVLLASYAYFYQAGGWNQNSRFALVRAILERHTLRIDDYQLHTGDKALWNGHYYSDKPPGLSLMALPPAAAARIVSRSFGVSPESFPGIAWTSYAATVLTTGVFTVIAALCVFLITRRWGYSPGAGLFAAVAYGLAGPAWGFATVFMSHGVTAGCLIGAFAAGVALDDARRSRLLLAAVLGVAAGWAVVTELQAAVAAALIVAVAVAREFRFRRSEFPATMTTIAVGGLLCAAVLFGYNAWAFDSPLHIGYASEEGFAQLRTGFFGITVPHWWRVRELLIGQYRGLLLTAPLVALTPIGLAVLAADSRRRTWTLVAAFVPAYYVVLNASYFYWEGGWSYTPRQLTPALPFAALGLVPLWDLRARVVRAGLLTGLVAGIGLTLVAVSTNPQVPSTFKAPMRELLWPSFRAGHLSLNTQTFVHGTPPAPAPDATTPPASWNLGEIAGLHGHASLVPLGLVWLAGLVALRR